MKTELIFFNGFSDSWEGIKRGFIATVTLIILYLISGKFQVLLPLSAKKIISSILALIILASAISVQNPANLSEAIVYSALVGFVIYSIFNLFLIILYNRSISESILCTLWGTFICIIASIIVYVTYWKNLKKL